MDYWNEEQRNKEDAFIVCVLFMVGWFCCKYNTSDKERSIFLTSGYKWKL